MCNLREVVIMSFRLKSGKNSSSKCCYQFDTFEVFAVQTQINFKRYERICFERKISHKKSIINDYYCIFFHFQSPLCVANKVSTRLSVFFQELERRTDSFIAFKVYLCLNGKNFKGAKLIAATFTEAIFVRLRPKAHYCNFSTKM